MASVRAQTNFIPALLVIAGFIGGYIYYLGLPAPEAAALPSVIKRDDLKRLANISINFDVLDGEEFKNLKIYGESPVSAGATGKTDIFSPF